ncbi:MAG: hypothetical protein KDD53_07295 [Bdellovibrionales bacterium]|nr:hypothetical protein [Bdellovibrionales bacterium]
MLPLEPAFYWVSTNNGDDNQLFHDTLQAAEGDFWKALERVVEIAPNGASAMQRRFLGPNTADSEESEETSVSQVLEEVFNMSDPMQQVS